MPAQALYLRWRPRTFDDVIGQGHITRALRNALVQDRVRHAYLFNGPRGTGKTTMARILAKAVNCLHPDPAARPCDVCANCIAVNEGRFLDLIEIDAASHNGVDDVRDLRDKIAFAPNEGRFKVYIIDEVHRFSGPAFDALLKTLEEPPDHAIFVLATTELDKVPLTIRSRSLIFEFRRVSVRDVADRLQLIAAQESVNIERGALELVAQQGTGSVRDSISLLDQLIADPEDLITLDFAERALGTASSRTVGKLMQALIANDAAAGLDLINRAIDDGADPTQLGRQIVEYLRKVLLVQTGGPDLVDESEDTRAILQGQAGGISRDGLLRAIRAFNAALTERQTGFQPQLPLELALIESTRPLPVAEMPATSAPAAPPPSARTSEGSRAPATARSAAPQEPSRPAAPPPTPEPASAAAPAFKIGEVKRVWPDILQRVKQNNKPLAGLLEKVEPSRMEGAILILAASEGFVPDRLSEPRRRDELAKLLREVLNRDVLFKVVVNVSKRSVVDATIEDNPIIAEQLQSGAQISQIEEPEE